MTSAQQELVERGAVQAVRVHQETGRSSRLYTLEFSDGVQTWREPLWSVTTLLKALDKPALVYWAAREVAAAAFRDRHHLDTDLERFGEREAIYQLSQAPWSRREKSADVGTAVHTIIDAHVRGAEPPPVDDAVRERALQHFAQFRRFEEDYRPQWHGAEMTVVNPEHGWAGTLDELCVIGRRGMGVIDVKNTNPAGKKKDQPGVWPEHGLQLSAYAHATEVIPNRGVWEQPVPMPKVEWGAVLWLAPDRYALVEVDVSDATYRAFRIAAEMYRWQDGPGKRVLVGEQPPAVFGVLPTVDAQKAAVAAEAAVVTEQQRRALEAAARDAGVGHDGLKAVAREVCGVTSTKLIPATDFDAVLATVKATTDPGPEAA